jgi:excinuclease ABC subunit A
MKNILIKGARTHNLKNIDVTIPRDQLVVITGLSGSGKSSLAFDTLYAEGQRRYVESLSSYARQFLSVMDKPDVDHIEGLSPSISIQQKSTSHNPRSTVGTITEIYDYLRLLFARVGQPYCPEHNTLLDAKTISQMVDTVMALPAETKIMILSPIIRNRKGEFVQKLKSLAQEGFVRAVIDGQLYELEGELPSLDLRKKHNIEVVIDRLKVKKENQSRIAESLETAVKMSGGLVSIAWMDEPKKTPLLFSAVFACSECGYSLSELEPRLFSFNSPMGACVTCDGLGVEQFFSVDKLIPNPELSLEEGVIRGWEPKNSWTYSLLQALAKHDKFDLKKPWKKLSQKQQDRILNGTGDEALSFVYRTDKGREYHKNEPFEGILNNLERRYRETSSDWARDEIKNYLSTRPCDTCDGTRLKKEARFVLIENRSIADIARLSISDAAAFFNSVPLKGQRAEIASKILKEIQERLGFLINVGLNYLSLERSAETLSGGEAQRIRLASQIGSGLVGVMYILDEPSIGLHQRDNERLLKTLFHLRNLGNTVIVVEHDEDAIRAADHIIDMGPKAGVHGGYVVAAGDARTIANSKNSITGDYLAGRRFIAIPNKRIPVDPKKMIKISKASGNNLKDISVEIPIGLMTCVTGVSGSGKSTLINDTLYPRAAEVLNGAESLTKSPCKAITGLEHFTNIIDIDQSPIGRTPRSNPATYTGMFSGIRELFAATIEARTRGYEVGRFSFNVKGGRCEACEGDGLIRVEMHFLPDVFVQCEVCHGKRYNRETLEIHYKGKTIHEVLEMSIEEALDFFKAVPSIAKKLQTLVDVGLSYIRLGQSATTLSGGEAQRVKLGKELSRRDTGNTLYLLDEPTTGLHFYDIEQLLTVLHRLRNAGNTIIVIEHNLDVIKTADWVIDLGPEGGQGGGQVIATGTPETVAKNKQSYTGQFLAKIL